MQPPEVLILRKEDFPGALASPASLDALFLPLNRQLDAVRKCLARGVGVEDNTAFEVRTLTLRTPSTDWVTATLLNSWVDAALGGEVPGYRKDAAGYVQGRGQVKNGVLGSPAFTMGASYWPAGLKVLPAAANNVGTATYGELRVSTSGNVTPQAGANTYFSFDGLWFLAADRTPVPLSCFPVDFQLQRVTSPLGVSLIGVRDVTSQQQGGGAEPVLALGAPKLQLLGGSKVRLQNLPGLGLGRSYELTFLAFA